MNVKVCVQPAYVSDETVEKRLCEIQLKYLQKVEQSVSRYDAGYVEGLMAAVRYIRSGSFDGGGGGSGRDRLAYPSSNYESAAWYGRMKPTIFCGGNPSHKLCDICFKNPPVIKFPTMGGTSLICEDCARRVTDARGNKPDLNNRIRGGEHK